MSPRTFSVICASLAFGGARAQTEPIQPKTVEVSMPAAIQAPKLAVPDPASVKPLSVSEAVRIALRNQPSLQIAQANAVAAKGRVEQAGAGVGPSLAVTGSATTYQPLHGEYNGGGASPGYVAGVTLTQLLFDFERTRDTVRQSEALEHSARSALTKAENDLVLQTKQAFYTYLQSVRQVTLAEANLKDRQSQVDLAQARLTAGLGAPADLVTAKTQLNQATLDLITARGNIETNRSALAQTLGIDPRTPLNAEDPGTDGAVSPTDASVDLALMQRPEIQQIKASLLAAGYGVSIARKSNLPSLSFSGIANTRGDNGFTDAQRASLALTVSWNLYDNGVRHGKIVEAEANRVSLEAQLTQTIQQVVNDVSTAEVNLQVANQRLTVSDAQVANATELVRLAEGRYRAGVATFLEVTDAEAQLVTARTNLNNAKATLQIAKATFERSIGKKA